MAEGHEQGQAGGGGTRAHAGGEGFAVLTWSGTGPLGFGGFAETLPCLSPQTPRGLRQPP